MDNQNCESFYQDENTRVKNFNELLLQNEDSEVLLKYIIATVEYIPISLPTIQYFSEYMTNNDDANTIFAYCCRRCEIDVLVHLLNNYQIDRDRYFPIKMAILSNNLDTIKFLINEGFNIHMHNNNILMIAGYRCSNDIIDYFLDIGLVITDEVIKFNIFKPLTLKLFIARGIDPERISHFFWEHLEKNPSIMATLELLVGSGVDINRSIDQYRSNKSVMKNILSEPK